LKKLNENAIPLFNNIKTKKKTKKKKNKKTKQNKTKNWKIAQFP
jgi:hypothetical protein